MRHFVLTRSSYGPAWDIEANRRRLLITKAVTARLMAAQTTREWTWIVLLDERDPLLEERMAVFRSAAPRFVPIMHKADFPETPADRQRIAAADYQAPWREAIGPRDEQVISTRLDDDDGFATDALARYQRLAATVKGRAILMLPHGVRVWDGRYDEVWHDKNAMHSLVTPPGDEMCVYDYGHTKAHSIAKVYRPDALRAWLWVRHRDTLSDWRLARRPLNDRIRGAFPVDWGALAEAWG